MTTLQPPWASVPHLQQHFPEPVLPNIRLRYAFRDRHTADVAEASAELLLACKLA